MLQIPTEKPRRSRILLVALWIVLLVTSLFLLVTFINIIFPSSSSRRVSLDWAGYVVTSDILNPQPIVSGATGSWAVPTINVTLKDMFSATWIGIGGETDQTLIQIGTEQDSIGGRAKYSVWYELLPSDSITITTLHASPGDKIAASITLVNSTTNKWSIEIDDATSGQMFQKRVTYTSSKLSAEWILERPTANNAPSTLANFGKITFTDARVTMNNNIGTITSFPYAQVTMSDRQNRPLVNVSSLISNGSSFTIDYLS
jgi:hypothetical protein